MDLHSQLEEGLSRLEQELHLVYEMDIEAVELDSACRDMEIEGSGIADSRESIKE